MKSRVQLYIYDLSQGMAKMLSMQLTGKQIDAIWHTSVVVHGIEYYFGSGIQTSIPGKTAHGLPLQVNEMGLSEKSKSEVEAFINQQRQIWTASRYHLLDNNCNTFSNALCQYLVDKSIPAHITGLPAEFLNSPFGAAMRPMIDNIFGASAQMGNQEQPEPNASSSKTVHRNFLHILTPELDKVSKTPLLSTQSSNLDAIFSKCTAFFIKNDININDAVFNQIKTELAMERGSTKSMDLPSGWNLIFEKTFSKPMTPDVFPVLDIMRLLALDAKVQAHFLEEVQYQPSLPVNILHQIAGNAELRSSKALMMMATRLANNMFANAVDQKSIILMLSMGNSIKSHSNGPNIPYRSVTTSLMIEAILSKDIAVRELGYNLAFNISLYASAKEQDENQSVHEEWVCEIFAALIGCISEYGSDPKVLCSLGFLLRGCSPESFEGLQGIVEVLSARDVITLGATLPAAGALAAEICALLQSLTAE